VSRRLAKPDGTLTTSTSLAVNRHRAENSQSGFNPPNLVGPTNPIACYNEGAGPRARADSAGLRLDARAQRYSASVVKFAVRARAVVVMVVMIVMVDFGPFGSREIGPGREPFIDSHGRRYRQHRDHGAEQYRA
jgi:hypothetical protein